MDDLNLLWIGSRGVGKQTQIHKTLAHVAHTRGVQFQIHKSIWTTETNKRLQRESECPPRTECHWLEIQLQIWFCAR
jgi:hypothetical protein